MDYYSTHQRIQVIDRYINKKHLLSKNLSYYFRYHGQASGIFSCSEHLAGLVPSQVPFVKALPIFVQTFTSFFFWAKKGSETCTVVETMFSFEILFSVFGNISYADRVEQLAFNALPAALTPEM